MNASEVKLLVVLFKSSVVLLESFSSYLLLPLPTLLSLFLLSSSSICLFSCLGLVSVFHVNFPQMSDDPWMSIYS